MTSHDLYAVDARAYVELSHLENRRLHTVERTIEELARHDATDGRPMRTRADFELALRDGQRVLPGLDLAVGAGT